MSALEAKEKAAKIEPKKQNQVFTEETQKSNSRTKKNTLFFQDSPKKKQSYHPTFLPEETRQVLAVLRTCDMA